MNLKTVYHVLADSAGRFGDAPALHQPSPGRGKKSYETYSWKHYLAIAEETAAGLRSLGFQQGDVVALYTSTRAEFYLSDLGVMSGGCISAAIYDSYSAEQVHKLLPATQARGIFVEDPKALKKLQEAAPPEWNLPCFLLTGEADGAISFEALRARGRELLATDPSLCRNWQDSIRSDSPAILYMTSGATGEPKMALVSHRSLLANLEMVPKVLDWLGPYDRTLAFLPSAHIAQRVAVELVPIPLGMQVWFSESLLKLPHEMRSIRPTFFLAPPRMWERIHATIRTEVGKKSPVQRAIFDAAIDLGSIAYDCRQRGKEPPALVRLRVRLFDRLVYSRIRERFGGEMRLAVSGAAPLGKDLARFYQAIGLPLVEGYGLTEGGVTVLNPFERPKAGTIGKPLPGVEARISEEGELLLRSETTFLGYWGDPAATAQVLRDGWLHTGDIASIDNEGYITITGRKKELIVLSTGKKVYPNRIEGLLKTNPLINYVLLVGDRLPYLTALITVNPVAAESIKGMDSWRGRPANEIVLADPVVKRIEQTVKLANRSLDPWEQIRRFHILDRDFSIESGELTPTMKVRRSRALENFRNEIHDLYAGKEESH